MLKSLDQRLADLPKAGFKVTKYREIKSGMQYKILTPNADPCKRWIRGAAGVAQTRA